MYRWEERTDHDLEPDVLPRPPARFEARVFQALTVSAVPSVVSGHAAEAGMDQSRRNDLVLAANEIANNSVRHAGGWGLLRMWRDTDPLVCEVADHGGTGLEALRVPRRPGPEQVNGYGLWLANELCERVEVSSAHGGTVVRLQMPV